MKKFRKLEAKALDNLGVITKELKEAQICSSPAQNRVSCLTKKKKKTKKRLLIFLICIEHAATCVGVFAYSVCLFKAHTVYCVCCWFLTSSEVDNKLVIWMKVKMQSSDNTRLCGS